MSEEIWKTVKGYEGIYEVSSLGRVRKMSTGLILRQGSDRDGYAKVSLRNGEGFRQHGVHRLVAAAFIPNPLRLPMVNHKNEVKNDNRVENLEWCNNSYNVTYNDSQKKGRWNATEHDETIAKRKAIGSTLRRLRAGLGMSQADMAKRLGLAGGTVCNIESGKNTPSFDTLERMANVLGCTITITRKNDA